MKFDLENWLRVIYKWLIKLVSNGDLNPYTDYVTQSLKALLKQIQGKLYLYVSSHI